MDYGGARQRMVAEQLVVRGISDPRIIAAFSKVPREEFVPETTKPLAYIDAPLAIGHDQTISQPYTVARMTELLELQANDRVLEIGTGSGYQAAILAELTKQVFTIERLKELADLAGERLTHLGYQSVAVVVGDGSLGLPAEAPFDGIIITAGAPEIPGPLIDQLAIGGRLVAPVGGATGQEMIRLIKVREGQLERESFGWFRFVPLIRRP